MGRHRPWPLWRVARPASVRIRRMKRAKPSVRRALSLSFTRSGITFAFNVATVTIVSRLLTPSEVGVFSVAVAFVALVQMLRDFGVSEFIGQFYGNPGVAQVAKVLSLVFLLMPFGTTTQSYMRRDMQFGLLVRIQTAETATRSITTIALAYLGFSYMSMAWGSVAAMGVVVIGCVIWGGEYRVSGLGVAEWKR